VRGLAIGITWITPDRDFVWLHCCGSYE
jgi:hypothetical protein